MRKLKGHHDKPLADYFAELAKYCQNNNVDKDTYGAGDFLNNFEKEFANYVGMESALFLPSGVMAQLIAIKIWGDEASSSTYACHESCHLIRHEEDSYKELLNFDVELVGKKDLVPLKKDLESLTDNVSSYIHELPMRHLGGDLPEFNELEEIKKYCKERDIKFHIDGARIFEASSYYNVSVKEIVTGADSLFISFYKGFGSTSGSMLFGSSEFIARAKTWLRRFGGNLFQLYSLAIPAKMQFDKNKEKFPIWKKRTNEITEQLKNKLNLEIIPYPTKTNMFHTYLPASKDYLRAKFKEYETKGIDVYMGVWEETEKGCRIEFTVGESTLEFSNDEIVDIFSSLIEN